MVSELHVLFNQHLTVRGFNVVDFEEALAYLVLMGLVTAETRESKSGYDYWFLTFPSQNVILGRSRSILDLIASWLADAHELLQKKRVMNIEKLSIFWRKNISRRKNSLEQWSH